MIHAQVPNQRHWKEANGQIGDGRTDTVEIRDCNESVLVDTGPMACGRSLVPEVWHWITLEDSEEQEHQTDRSGEGNSRIKNPGMEAINRNAQQGDDNRDFGEDASDHVENLA